MAEEAGRPEEYGDDMVALLQLIWGKGFMTPGGVPYIRRTLAGRDLRGRKVLDIGSGLGGHDIVLARETCAREAEEKALPLTSHAAHLLVHGTLHLLGYDHLDDETAEDMEASAYGRPVQAFLDNGVVWVAALN